MLSFGREELRLFTRPICPQASYDGKLRNLEAVEQAFLRRDERCEGLPVHLHVEPSGDCNLRCAICPRGRGLIERRGGLAFKAFERAFDTVSDHLANIVISGWGEPLLNPETPRMIGQAIGRGVSVFMNSNGTRLLENVGKILDSGLTVLCVALDGAMSHATHAYNDESPFEHVIKGVERLCAARERGGYSYPRIHGLFIVTEENLGEVEAMVAWASRLGIERTKFKRRMRTMPGQVERSRLDAVQERLEIKAHAAVRSEEDLTFTVADCSHPWDSLFLDCRGRLGLCSWDPHRRIDFGEAGGDLNSIWNGEQIRSVRRWHSGQGSSAGAPCLSCNRVPGYLIPAPARP
jgi:MoaA/NifB/PqqE/SkfB family radical SAM enzyme